MVRFEKDKIVVEIPPMFPAADWPTPTTVSGDCAI